MRTALLVLLSYVVVAAASETPPPVDPSEFPEIFLIQTVRGVCNAVAVGPRALLTSSSCLDEKQPAVTVTVGDKRLKGYGVQSPYYTKEVPHNLGFVLVFGQLPVVPRSVTHVSPQLDDVYYAAAYGCKGEGLQGDELRVDAISPYLFSATPQFGCDERGGLAAFNRRSSNQRFLLGIGSPLHEHPTRWVRLDTDESALFLEDMARMFDVVICGVNQLCL